MKRMTQRLGARPGFARIFKHVAPRVDRFVHRLSRGRVNAASAILPTLVLVHRGRRSGKEYRTPLSYIRVGDGFGLAATNWGQTHHPAWSGNLLANPEAIVELKGERIPVRARLASDEEKAELWPRFVQMWPAYDTYVERSGRDIRVFVLERR